MTKLSSPPRLFSAEEANKTLPLVSVIVGDLMPLWRQVNSTRRRIRHLIETHGLREGSPYSEELSAIQEKLAEDSMQIEGFIDELREVGAEFRGVKSAHVCFPAMLDGRLVYLSWLPGETEVSHWIDLDGEVVDRKSLLAAV